MPISPDDKAQSQETVQDPLYNDYNDIKVAHPDEIVVFKVGDFFEMYGEDARQAASELDLNLATRPVAGAERVNMCGIPAHSLEQYVEKLRERHDVTIASTKENGQRNIVSLKKLETESNLAATLPTVSLFYDWYAEVKSQYPDAIVLIKLNGGYLSFQADTQFAVSLLGLEAAQREHLGEPKRVSVCYMPNEVVEEYLDRLASR